MGDEPSIHQEPVSVLFNPRAVIKKDVWSIDLVDILDMLSRILEKNGKGDLRVAGIAALSSSLIYRMKVESIFAMQKAAMTKRPPAKRRDVDIDTISMPYRHQSTYAVSLDDLLGLLQNLVVSLANPRSKRKRRSILEKATVPDMMEHLHTLESVIGQYQDLILKKLQSGPSSLQDIVASLDSMDSIRCFFAMLYLARDNKVSLEQDGDDILIMRVMSNQT